MSGAEWQLVVVVVRQARAVGMGPCRGEGGKVGLNCMLAVNHDVPSSRESY